MSDPIVSVFVPGRLVNPLNRRKGWRVVWGDSKNIRLRVAGMTRRAPVLPAQPKRVILTAHVWSLFDISGLQAACKPVIDGLLPAKATLRKVNGRHQFVSSPGSGLIHSDAPNSGHVFEHRQVVDRAHPGVEIVVTALEETHG